MALFWLPAETLSLKRLLDNFADMSSSSSSSSSSSISNTSLLLSPLHSLPREIRNLLSGGFAGMLAKSAVAPVDRIKILYQVTDAHFRLRDIPTVLLTMIRTEGLVALWKGNGVTMMRVFPYSGIQFMVFDYCKSHFLGEHARSSQQQQQQQLQLLVMEETTQKQQQQQRGKQKKEEVKKKGGKSSGLSPIESLQAGVLAGTVSTLITYPLDVARVQLAVLRRTTATSSSSVASSGAAGSSSSSTMMRGHKGIGYVLSASYERGGVLGLYRGITPTLLGMLPYSGIAFTINEQAKRQITHITNREPTTIERLLCGGLSGLFAQTLSYPLEVTRRRMQTIGIVPTTGPESATTMVTQFAKANGTATTVAEAAAAVTIQATTATTAAQKRQLLARPPPPSMIMTMTHLFNEQGIRGFYKGLTMNWVKGPVAFSISFTAFDTIKGLLETDEERSSRSIVGGGLGSGQRSSAKVNIARQLTDEHM